MHIPPIIAMAIGITFIYVMLRWSGDGLSKSPAALWVPTMFFLYSASRPLGGWLGSGGSTIAEGSGIDRLFVSTLILLGLVILFRRGISLFAVLQENKWLTLLCAYMLFSVLWSDYSLISFKRWFRFCGTPIMALVILTDPAPRAATELIMRRTAYVLIPLSLVLIRYYSSVGINYDLWTGERMWVGVTTQKNGLGRLCLISAFFLIWAIIRAWPEKSAPAVAKRIKADALICSIALFLLRGPSGAHSATSIAALALGIAMYVILSRTWRHDQQPRSTLQMTAVAMAVFCGILFPLAGGSAVGGVLSIMGRDVTFTGRTVLWQAILPVALANPILGVGYGSFWIKPPISYDLSIMVNESHNGYLDIFVETGVVGLSLFLIFLFCSCLSARKALLLDREWGAFALCFLLIIVVHNITESSFLRPTNHMGAVFFLFAMLARRFEASSLEGAEVRSTGDGNMEQETWTAHEANSP
jgi:exopolysaccharide production protein ExoQ